MHQSDNYGRQAIQPAEPTDEVGALIAIEDRSQQVYCIKMPVPGSF